jgi:hypothetical protein
MECIFKFFVKKFAMVLIGVTFISLAACGQTIQPTPQNLQELLPNVDPTQLTKSGFDSYFKDNNQPSKKGTDRSKDNPSTAAKRL